MINLELDFENFKFLSIIFLIILSGIFKGLMDFEAHENSESWKNKYAKGLLPSGKPWYYFNLYKPKYKEAFPFSATFLVSLTDLWHFYQITCFLFLHIAIILACELPFYWLFISFFLFNIVFSIIYNTLRKRWD